MLECKNKARSSGKKQPGLRIVNMNKIYGRQKKLKLPLHFYRITKTLSVKDFLARVKNDPWCIVNDPKTKKALKTLQMTCTLSSIRVSESSKFVLQRAGLSVFIPEEAKKRRADTSSMRYWKSHSRELVKKIELIKSEIKPFLKARYKKGYSINKGEDIKKALEHFIQKYKLRWVFDTNEEVAKNLLIDEKYWNEKFSFPDEVLRKLKEGERDSNVTLLALSFFAYIEEIPFPALKKLYFSL